jgi:hypothetical protein
MAKKSARQLSPKDVTGVPTPVGGSPNAGVAKRVVKGGGQVDKRLQGGSGQKK